MSQTISTASTSFVESTVFMQQISNVHQNIIPPTCAVEIPQFYGIPELLETIDPRKLDVKNALELMKKHRKVLITGMGGIGKTTLAVLCAQKWVKNDDFKHAVFVNVESYNSADVIYQRLCELILNTKIYSDNTITELYEYYNKEKTLIIFDNIEENRILSKYLPSESLKNIYLLGTSQYTELTKVFQVYTLQTLSEEASVNLVETILKNNKILIPTHVAHMITNLVRQLEYHPLAIQHATALIYDLINNNNLTLKKSLEEYNTQFETLFRREFPVEHVTKYNKSVNTALELNIRKAIRSDEEKHVQKLLFCMSYLDPSGINIRMFYKHPAFTENSVRKSVRELKKYSIITVNKSYIVTLHRLIQVVCHSMIFDDDKKDYLDMLLNIFFYHEDAYHKHIIINNHCYYLIQHFEINFKIDKLTLSKLYIKLFHKNNELVEHLTSRLKLINCNISCVEDWSVQQYCVFADHSFFFYYFNKNTDTEEIRLENNIYHSQILKGSQEYVFDRSKSIVGIYKRNIGAINQPSFNGLIILSICAAFGIKSNVFDELISLGCDINIPDNNGMTPILWAAKNMSFNLVFKLHKHGAIYDDQYKELLSAASTNNHELVLELLRVTEFNYASDFVKTLLWWAAENEHYDLVRELLHRGVDITGVDTRGNTVVNLVAQKGNFEIVAELISLGVNVNTANIYGCTPLLYAAECGFPDVVAHLIRAGAKVDIANKDGDMPLLRAAEKGYLEIVVELIVAEANVNIVDYNGNTPLLLAAKKGHFKVVAELIRSDADVDLVNNEGVSPLYSASGHGHCEVVAKLICAGADVHIVNNNGNTALSYAAYFGHNKVVSELIRAGADVNTVNIIGDPPLIRHHTRWPVEAFAEPIRPGYPASLLNKLSNMMALLEGTAGHGHPAITLELIRAGADVNIVNKYNNTALLFAAYYGHPENIGKMISLGAYVNTTNIYGDTPLLLAAEARGYRETVAELIKLSADVNIANGHGSTPLLMAVKYNKCRLPKLGADVNIANGHGSTPLLMAVKYNKCRLPKLGADVNIANRDDSTPLSMAVEYTHREIITELLKQGAHVNIRDDEGESPILFAVKSRDRELVNELISPGANIDIPANLKGETPHCWTLQDKNKILGELLKIKPVHGNN